MRCWYGKWKIRTMMRCVESEYAMETGWWKDGYCIPTLNIASPLACSPSPKVISGEA